MTEIEILHKSLWAVTIQFGSIVRKYYLHNDEVKIKKENNLLTLATGIDCEVKYDYVLDLRYAEMPYFEFEVAFDKDGHSDLLQIKKIFNTWNREQRFSELVTNTWASTSLPFFCSMMELHLDPEISKKEVAYLKSLKPLHFIHGDFQIQNIAVYNKKLLVLDFENAEIGPILWDETTLVYSLIENGYHSVAQEAFDLFKCTHEMLLCIAAIKLAQSLHKSKKIETRTRAYNYIIEHYSKYREVTNE